MVGLQDSGQLSPAEHMEKEIIQMWRHYQPLLNGLETCKVQEVNKQYAWESPGEHHDHAAHAGELANQVTLTALHAYSSQQSTSTLPASLLSQQW